MTNNTMNRRTLITGLVSLIAAPAIVRASSIMPVRAWREIVTVGVDIGCEDCVIVAVAQRTNGTYSIEMIEKMTRGFELTRAKIEAMVRRYDLEVGEVIHV